ncbi:hypothetical protein ASF69_01290 [Rhizobium sp. Leaf311]|nr:hypothetical protein ASF69_01290 [Rhizobium sp. Leaf311]
MSDIVTPSLDAGFGVMTKDPSAPPTRCCGIRLRAGMTEGACAEPASGSDLQFSPMFYVVIPDLIRDPV